MDFLIGPEIEKVLGTSSETETETAMVPCSMVTIHNCHWSNRLRHGAAAPNRCTFNIKTARAINLSQSRLQSFI